VTLSCLPVPHETSLGFFFIQDAFNVIRLILFEFGVQVMDFLVDPSSLVFPSFSSQSAPDLPVLNFNPLAGGIVSTAVLMD